MGVHGAFRRVVSSSHPRAERTFASICEAASWREGQAEDPGNPTNKSRAVEKEQRLSGTIGSGRSRRDSLGYFQTLSPLVSGLFVFSNCILFSADSFAHCIHF